MYDFDTDFLNTFGNFLLTKKVKSIGAWEGNDITGNVM